MYQPDQTDWEIISLLIEDGRMSNAEIARRLGNISPRTVTNRIYALTEHEIINIRAIVNPERIGYSVIADVFIEVDPGKIRGVADTLAEYPQISYVACATGDTDIIISIRAFTIEELYDFVIEVVSKVSGVRHTETYLLPLNIKTITTWIPHHIFDDGEGKKSKNPMYSQGEKNEQQ